MKVLCRFVTIVLLLTAVGATSGRCEDKEVDGVMWTYTKIDASTCSIAPKEAKGLSGAIVIPREIGGLKVVEIARDAFQESQIVEVTIPSSVKTIGQEAFLRCAKLQKVTLYEGVETIGQNAFSTCNELKRVVLPGSVKELDKVFYGCDKLEEIVLGEGVEVLKGQAITSSKSLKTLTIPSTVKKIEDDAVSGCSALVSVFFLAPSTIDIQVDNGNFYDLASDAKLYVPKGKKAEFDAKVKDLDAAFKSVEELGVVVTFDAAGGTPATLKQLAAADGALAKPADPVKEGATFEGWIKKGEAKAFNFGSDKVIDEGVTLEAKWSGGGATPTPAPSPAPTPTPPAPSAKVSLTYEASVVKVTKGGAEAASGAEVKAGEELVIAPAEADKVFAELKVNGAAKAEAIGKASFTYKVLVDDKAVKIEATVKAKDGEAPKPNPAPTPGQNTAVESEMLAGASVVSNPVGSVLLLEGVESAERVEVYSVTGALVHARKLRGEGRVEVSARSWASGVYVVRILARDGERAMRVVKK